MLLDGGTYYKLHFASGMSGSLCLMGVSKGDESVISGDLMMWPGAEWRLEVGGKWW